MKMSKTINTPMICLLILSAMITLVGCSGGGSSAPPAPDIIVTDAVAPYNDALVPFGSVTAGNTSDQTITVTNNRSVSLAIGTIAAADPLAAPFSITADTCSGQTISSGATCTVTVRFTPTSPSSFSDTFDVPNNDPAQNPVTISVSGKGFVPLRKTGLTTTYDAGAVKGDDGALQKGSAWPAPRFQTNPDTSVNDKLTGLIWGPNGNVMKTRDIGWDQDFTANDGCVTWQHALDYIAKLNAENYLGHSDWRLPNIMELQSLANYGVSDIAGWLNGSGFSNVFMFGYWSSTSVAGTPQNAWYLWTWNGHIYQAAKTNLSDNYGMVWPVRSGPSALSTVPQTGQTLCSNSSGTTISCTGTGQDGALQAGVAWPGARFTVASGTATDNLTSLVWASDASTPSVGACTGGVKAWQEALDYVACLNAGNYLGFSDWRLPNVNELQSLVNFGTADVSAWLNSAGMSNVAPVFYWTSTTRFDSTDRARYVDMSTGFLDNDVKTNTFNVWPVRGGQ